MLVATAADLASLVDDFVAQQREKQLSSSVESADEGAAGVVIDGEVRVEKMKQKRPVPLGFAFAQVTESSC